MSSFSNGAERRASDRTHSANCLSCEVKFKNYRGSPKNNGGRYQGDNCNLAVMPKHLLWNRAKVIHHNRVWLIVLL